MRGSLMACLMLMSVASAAEPKPLEGVEKIRSAIRLASLDICSGVMLSDNKMIYAGESPLLYAQIQQAEKDLTANPNNLAMLRTWVQLKARMNDIKQTRAAYEKLYAAEKANITANPQDATGWQYFSCCCWHAGKPDEALVAARKAVELDPKDPLSWQYLYWALKVPNPVEAEAAFEKAVALTPEHDLDQRIVLAIIRSTSANEKLQQMTHLARVEQVGAIRLPGVLEADRNKATEEYLKSVNEVDRVVSLASRKLKENGGQCGADTRDRCLALLFMRDMIRAGDAFTQHMTAKQEVAGPAVKSDTLQLMREVVPLTSEDPVRIFSALFVEMLSRSELKQKFDRMPPTVLKVTEPYLKRLLELSQHKDPATAGTAAYMHAMTCKLMNDDAKAIQASLLRALELCPQYNDAWQLLLLTYLDQKDLAKAYEVGQKWHDTLGNEVSLFSLAKAYAEGNDWANVRRVSELGVKKFPDSLRFQLAIPACDLQTGDPIKAVEKVKPELYRLATVIEQTRADPKLAVTHQQLCMVMSLLENNLSAAREYGKYPLLAENNPERKKLLEELMFPKVPMPISIPK